MTECPQTGELVPEKHFQHQAVDVYLDVDECDQRDDDIGGVGAGISSIVFDVR